MVALGQSAAARHPAETPSLPTRVGFADAHAPWPQLEPHTDERAARRQALARAIEQTVLPRLLLTHGSAAAHPDLEALYGAAPTVEDVERLCALLIADDRAGCAAQVSALRQRGVPLERICLEWLAPAARRLGEAWEEDRCDFATVTLALLRLQQMVRDFGPDFTRDVRPQARRRRILLANPPGEQHSFGRDMLAGFFRHAGWDVWDPPPRNAIEFAALVRRESFQVIGISAASEGRLEAVAACIRTVRQSPRNRGAGIMVGGPIFISNPEYVALVGADATAADGQQATLQAERLISLMTHWD
jgi:methylmalonyl-CoA mutase cobalamin-binding subunit